MRVAKRKRVALALVALSLAASRTLAQGLGDAADRERARREALLKERGPARVLTERDANPTGDWHGWRDWHPPDARFTIRMPSRPLEERNEVAFGRSTHIVSYYHARDELGSEYWVSVADYPADYVRFQAFRIWAAFPSHLMPYNRNDDFVQQESHLGGLPVTARFGTYSQLVACLVGTRFYELMVTAAPGDYFAGRDLHPFFLTFRL
jgi:hypothetical protein